MTTSVALCTYNGEKYLAEQLDSILSQEIAVDEIIACDDGSSDGTWDILNRYHQEFPSIIKIYRNTENMSFIKNFESAIKKCSNEIIFLSDQDDIWKPSKVGTVLHYFENNLDKQAVFHDTDLLENGEILSFGNWHSIFYQPSNPHGISLFHYLILLGNVVTGASFAFRKQNKNWNFNSSSILLLHDYQMALHYATKNALGIIHDSLSIYRLHEGQQVGTHLNNRQKRKEAYDKFVNSSLRQKIKFYESKSQSWKNKLHASDEEKIQQFIEKEIEILKEKQLENSPFILRMGIIFYREKKKKIKAKT